MRTLLRAALGACLVLLATAIGASAMTISEVRSPGGLTAWLVQSEAVPVISVAFEFEGGASQDPAGKEGLASLLTTMFDEGAGPLDGDAFGARVEELGLTLGLSARRDGIAGALRTLRDDRDEAFRLLRLALVEPRLDPAALERMRGELIARHLRRENSPAAEGARRLRESLFPDHPYGRPQSGTPESLARITREDIAAAWKSLLVRAGLRVAVVGAISPEEVAAMLDQVFGALPEGTRPPAPPTVEPALGERLVVDAPGSQTAITLALPGVRRSSPDFLPAHLLVHMLGGSGFSSRLYTQVRETRGLAYSADAELNTLDASAWISAGAATRADRVAETETVMRAEIERLGREGPSEAELEAARRTIIGGYPIANLGSSMDIARTLLTIQSEGLGIDYIDRRAGLIEAVTADQVRTVARRLLLSPPTVLLVGPGAR